ncbi:MAG: isoprenylcysteine carboxylmethyltransferase family protein [Thermoplasmata archaeon]|nr:isoprenylcysteine carboxylmethyltransferase family protein [Thermoplasmata archaeon]
MADYKEMKKKYPRTVIIMVLVIQTIIATILILFLRYLFIFFDITEQNMVDVFTYPANFIPDPYNWAGVLLIPVGMFIVIWANYALLWTGRIEFKDREPMQRPKTLVLTGPFRFSRNPIYFGNILMMMGLVIVWSSIVTLVLLILVYLLFRYFIKKEEIILKEEFGKEYRKFKKRVRRWI